MPGPPATLSSQPLLPSPGAATAGGLQIGMEASVQDEPLNPHPQPDDAPTPAVQTSGPIPAEAGRKRGGARTHAKLELRGHTATLVWSAHGVSAAVKVDYLAQPGCRIPQPVAIVVQIAGGNFYYTTRAECVRTAGERMRQRLTEKTTVSADDITDAVGGFRAALELVLRRPEYDAFIAPERPPLAKHGPRTALPANVPVYAAAGEGGEKLGRAGSARRVIRDYPPDRRRALLWLARREGRWPHVDWNMVAESLNGESE